MSNTGPLHKRKHEGNGSRARDEKQRGQHEIGVVMSCNRSGVQSENAAFMFPVFLGASLQAHESALVSDWCVHCSHTHTHTDQSQVIHQPSIARLLSVTICAALLLEVKDGARQTSSWHASALALPASYTRDANWLLTNVSCIKPMMLKTETGLKLQLCRSHSVFLNTHLEFI